MYTNELKEEIRTRLLRFDVKSKQWSTNPKIFLGWYSEKHHLKPLIDHIISITDFASDRTPISERIYLILNDLTEIPTCKCCTNSVKFKRFLLGYGEYCSSKCRANDPDWQQNVKDSNVLKYGVEFIAQKQDERLKRSKQMRINIQKVNHTEKNKKRVETVKRLYGNKNTGWLSNSINTRVRNKHMVPPELRDEYSEYRRLVELVTKKQPIDSLPNCKFRGILGKDSNAHHLDHIFSIYDGFIEGIDPEIIGNICNLQFIPGRQNITKGNHSDISKNELLERYNERIR